MRRQIRINSCNVICMEAYVLFLKKFKKFKHEGPP